MSRPEAKRFRVKLTNLNVAKIDLVEVFIDLLEAGNLKSKNLADEYLPLCQLMSPLLALRERA